MALKRNTELVIQCCSVCVSECVTDVGLMMFASAVSAVQPDEGQEFI